jgi:cytochrome c oxidase cbb3-type subunit 2
MPRYAFLSSAELDFNDIADNLRANVAVGVPYTEADIANAHQDVVAQTGLDADTSGLLERYPKAVTGDFDGNPMKITEMDALVAYLQMLGTLVDFSTYDAEANYR